MKKINENTKVTLTLSQLKRLVKESDYNDAIGNAERLFVKETSYARIYVLDDGTNTVMFGADDDKSLWGVLAEHDDESEAIEEAEMLWAMEVGQSEDTKFSNWTGRWTRIR